MKIIVTGGAGFIGSALVRHLVRARGDQVLTIDKLTYAGNRANLATVAGCAYHRLEVLDICDAERLRGLLFDFGPDALMHLAAESHVDRSIDGPADFIRTNILGTSALLEAVREYNADRAGDQACRFLHVSTDEVYGTLGAEGAFSESSPYRPNSPYSASKAASDHLVRAWRATYGLPAMLTNCSNNYGPYQFAEKLIPVIILAALRGAPVPLYGDGQQVRDWLYVDDHVQGLVAVLENGALGRTYNIGGDCEKTNLEVATEVLTAVAEQTDAEPGGLLRLIEFVKDRPGHDRRYAIDASRIRAELGWRPQTSFADGIRQTVAWYLDHKDWWAAANARGVG
ncbi:MAG: dTDP-glucose 4,6-dehydratase [Gammaproteobacteria bacterium]|nr:dTDP-glucose 4,6-dehydratase [Gammaproteobacteria bacterium]